MHAFFLARVENVTNGQTHIGGWVENVTNGQTHRGKKGDIIIHHHTYGKLFSKVGEWMGN